MPTQQLSDLQIELLKLYANGVGDANLREIKAILAKYFAVKASDAMDEFWEQENLSAEQMIDWTNEHNRAENSR